MVCITIVSKCYILLSAYYESFLIFTFCTRLFQNSGENTAYKLPSLQCVEKDESGVITFPTADQLRGNVFSVYLQMPVLFYLDFEIRAGLMQALRNATGSNNLCICRHQDFRVSYFEEG